MKTLKIAFQFVFFLYIFFAFYINAFCSHSLTLSQSVLFAILYVADKCFFVQHKKKQPEKRYSHFYY